MAQVRKLDWNSPELWKHIEDDIPVVIINCPLVGGVSGAWTQSYMADIIAADFPNTVYASESLVFQYWNTKTDVYEFSEPTIKVDMTMKEFLEASETGIANVQPNLHQQPPEAPPAEDPNDDSSAPAAVEEQEQEGNNNNNQQQPIDKSKRRYFYLQQSLVAEMGPKMMEEFQK
jgi:hypothetical protein